MSRMLTRKSSASSTQPAAPIRPARLAAPKFGLVWILAALLAGSVSAAEAAPRKAKAKAQSHVSSKARVGAESHSGAAAAAIAGSKIALLEFHGDNVELIRGQVIKVLKTKVREVSTNLRPADTTEQYRDMGAALALALYVQGHIKDTGKDQAVLTIDLRSGVSGKRIATVKFTGNRRKLYADAEDELWQKIERPFGRACLEATTAVRHHNAPMRIEAGSPDDSSVRSSL